MNKFDQGREDGHSTNREKSDSCNCSFYYESCPNSQKCRINIHINYILQTGKVNQVGDGSMQYRGKDNHISSEKEHVRDGYKILSDVVELLKTRDK